MLWFTNKKKVEERDTEKYHISISRTIGFGLYNTRLYIEVLYAYKIFKKGATDSMAFEDSVRTDIDVNGNETVADVVAKLEKQLLFTMEKRISEVTKE